MCIRDSNPAIRSDSVPCGIEPDAYHDRLTTINCVADRCHIRWKQFASIESAPHCFVRGGWRRLISWRPLVSRVVVRPPHLGRLAVLPHCVFGGRQGRSFGYWWQSVTSFRRPMEELDAEFNAIGANQFMGSGCGAGDTCSAPTLILDRYRPSARVNGLAHAAGPTRTNGSTTPDNGFRSATTFTFHTSTTFSGCQGRPSSKRRLCSPLRVTEKTKRWRPSPPRASTDEGRYSSRSRFTKSGTAVGCQR